jgi:hypothetical protein
VTAHADQGNHQSQQVSWWDVHTFVQRYLDTAGDHPWPGSPAWCQLPDNDRRKWAGLLNFAQHHALRVEAAQAAQADAATAVSEAADWANVASEIRQRSEFRAAHPWTRRKAVTR